MKRAPPAPSLRGEGGHVLLLVLLALVALSLLAAAAMLAARSERWMSRSHAATVGAREAARSAVADLLSSGSVAEGRRSFVTGTGTAEVETERLLGAGGADGTALYLVTARGVRSRPGPGPDAERTVALVAARRTVPLSAAAALTSASGLRAEGPPAVVSGEDACGAASAPDLGGAAVPDGGFRGDSASIIGAPPVAEGGTGRELLRGTGLDSATWEALSRSDRLPGVRNFPSDPWPATFAEWPVIRVASAAATLGAAESGQGTLLATGDLILEGTFAWRGLVLAGGAVRATESAAVLGAAVAGLNRHRGARPDTSSAAGASVLRYDSCALREALRRLPHDVRDVPGSWFERL